MSFYLCQDQTVTGPFGIEEITGHAKRGIRPGTLIQEDGTEGHWIPLEMLVPNVIPAIHYLFDAPIIVHPAWHKVLRTKAATYAAEAARLAGVLFLRAWAFIASLIEAPPTVPPQLPIPQPIRILSPEEIAAALDGAVMRYAAVGYRLVSRSPSMAQMVKPKSFSGWSLLLLFLWVLPFLIYLFVYWATRDAAVLITIAPNGVISAVKPQ